MITSEQDLRFQIVERWLEKAFGASWDGRSVLDIGCHSGTLCDRFLSRGARVAGIDVYDPKLAARARWSYTQQDLNDKGTLAFQDEAFDAVTALEIIEHVLDTDAFVAEVFRILRPNGWLCLSTPNINMFKNRLRVPMGLYPYSLEYRTVVNHVRIYNKQVLASHLEEGGFELVELRGSHLLPQLWLFGGSRRAKALASISDALARRLPGWSSNLVALARKPSTAAV